MVLVAVWSLVTLGAGAWADSRQAQLIRDLLVKDLGMDQLPDTQHVSPSSSEPCNQSPPRRTSARRSTGG